MNKEIILLHGAIGAKDQLTPLKDILNKKGFKVYSFSFSGHGKTSFEKAFSITQFSAELKTFIEINKLQSPSIFGYSMGGYVALYLAAMSPNLMGKLITLGTKFNWSKEIAEKEILNLNPKVISEKVPKFANALKERHGDDWELMLLKTANLMQELANNNLLSQELIQEINNDVLIGLGDRDSIVTFSETQDVFKSLKNGAMYMLPNTKHPIETINNKALADIITQFITQ